MNYLQLAMMAIGLIQIAEKVFDKKGQGETKKAFVKGAANAIVDSMGVVSTGGQKETWATIDIMMDPFIDLACRFLFPKEV